jgi:hypothetical protein
VQMWARENTVAVSAIRAPPPFYHPKFENLTDSRVYKSWRQLIFFGFFVARFRNLLASNFQITNISFVIFFVSEEAKINNCFWEMNFREDKILLYFKFIPRFFSFFLFGFCDIVTLATRRINFSDE